MLVCFHLVYGGGLNLSSEATLVLLLLPWTRPRFPATLRKKLSLPGAMAERIEEELRCPTCLNIFKDPVMLKCSHSFCRACVKQWWKHKQARSCPVCRKSSLPVDVSPNLTLKNVCETFTKVSVETETMCSLHGEKKKLFCLDHQQCVCLICRDAQIHSGHKFCSLDEIVQEHREKFQKSLQKVKENLAEFTEIQNNCSEQAEYIKVQKDLVESKIKKNFEELRQFLEVEEQAKLAALREEEQKKSHMMKEKMEALNRDMATLSDIISSTEKWVASDHVSFMNNYQVAMTTVQQLPDKPVLPPGALLDEVKHLGNLKFTVWFRMKETVSYSPVILDPNTASPHFNLSEDLTSVNFNGEKRCPMNPERCQYWNRVLGCALDPGTHIWDVEDSVLTSFNISKDGCPPGEEAVGVAEVVANWGSVRPHTECGSLLRLHPGYSPPLRSCGPGRRRDTGHHSVSSLMLRPPPKGVCSPPPFVSAAHQNSDFL
ncbi:E3 ubiquitin-protein ligase TRIM35-like isoform X3 [Syngnathoides biaculeatus]|uniref:E3 ubiquitin-protein ligase TRIM35-like isoform X3 n=1 Tax=Syngnathoides biaculeatus TaxID=300417 RepID=UPI002ADE300E|nr:E3 ubiquitin-protein ligase TRIM35-like isoform X3 [Syngnathoides biaculeatus]